MKSAVIKLTTEQKEELSELFTDMLEAHRRTAQNGGDPEERMAILGQVWSDTDTVINSGCAKFWLLNTAQYAVVNRAIRRAQKMREPAEVNR